ncbi:hypothetical protein H7J87_25545 [Mycolicibacterium wolinskyi]|uniref:Transmembrane protein n=1 Tax=Mycolicibacterium wolinskyi TaxID=59750 RepID=A0A1X2F1L0_9MYCO|nr:MULTISPECIES: hypothetical protein [Mycolicibacterium]MCV7288697.1 hypothetical protein [Mycolicibacterium wolinskyi]MCV7295919.1 hypothetical protein [Mycolicibacterium goodii]ORX11899.1 hypothetical protein AWC31_35245 [Mycolicibacterium wolinskyi]
MYHDAQDLRSGDVDVWQAVRFGLVAAAAGLGFLLMAVTWVSTCAGATADLAACGAPQRTALALGTPLILFVAGLRAFARAYQAWKRRETWWAWHGAGWLLTLLTLLVLVTSLPAFAGTGMTTGLTL